MRSSLATLVLVISIAGAVAQSPDRLPGKPIAKPLPDWCQHGECVTPTIEYMEPMMFHESGVLFRVVGQSWSFSPASPKKKTRDPGSQQSFVFCSKQLPAVIDSYEGKFMVTFLTLDDDSRYGHANEISLSHYFAVCHGRVFDSMVTGGAEFAKSLGYKVRDRDDQPTINRPQEIVRFLPKS